MKKRPLYQGAKRISVLSAVLMVMAISAYKIPEASAQKVAVKTNALYLVTTSPNLSIEAALSPRWTIELGGGVNPFTFKDNRKWKHYQWQGEARYWICESFYKHFIGIHAGGGEMNIGRSSCPWPYISPSKRYEGWAIKAGISYGYSFVLGGRWNLEANVGLGVIHADYDRYACASCGNFDGHFSKTMFAPTKLGLSLVYMIR